MLGLVIKNPTSTSLQEAFRDSIFRTAELDDSH